jgi:hypothetical protein
MLSYWPSCASPQSNGNAEELKQLDADEPEVNTLARLAVASQNVITKRRLQIPPDNSDLLSAEYYGASPVGWLRIKAGPVLRRKGGRPRRWQLRRGSQQHTSSFDVSGHCAESSHSALPCLALAQPSDFGQPSRHTRRRCYGFEAGLAVSVGVSTAAAGETAFFRA